MKMKKSKNIVRHFFLDSERSNITAFGLGSSRIDINEKKGIKYEKKPKKDEKADYDYVQRNDKFEKRGNNKFEKRGNNKFEKRGNNKFDKRRNNKFEKRRNDRYKRAKIVTILSAIAPDPAQIISLFHHHK